MWDVEGLDVAISDSAFLVDPKGNYTFSSGEPVEKIDYIFYNTKYIEKIDSRVVVEAKEISDHLPVLMRFVLK